MSESGTSPSRITRAVSRPKTVEQLLDREEALAVQRITHAVQRVGEEFAVATDLRARIRRHPYLSTALGACLGYLGGPLVGRTLKRALNATAGIPIPGGPAPRSLPGVILASVRSAYARP